MKPTLYSYFQSSAAWRVRIALAIKGAAVETVPVNLRRGGGEQLGAAYREVNPQGLVPCLVVDGTRISQSIAICEYLEEAYPDPPLLPRDVLARARVRALVQAIACDVHPLNNLRVLRYLKHELGLAQGRIDTWVHHWLRAGFDALEADLAKAQGTYCAGDALSLADVCLVPQVFNARRYKFDLAPYPRIVAIDAALSALPAFIETAPARQTDFVA